MTEQNDGNDPCDGCALDAGRRAFLGRAAQMASATLLALGVPSARALAMTLSPVQPIGRSRSVVSYPLPLADGVQIDRTNEIMLARWHNTVIAFNLACPHQQAPLRWLAEDSRFECPKHHSKYTPDGSYISGRATRAIDRMPITRRGDTIDVNVDTVIKVTDQPAAWHAAQIDIAP